MISLSGEKQERPGVHRPRASAFSAALRILRAMLRAFSVGVSCARPVAQPSQCLRCLLAAAFGLAVLEEPQRNSAVGTFG